MTTKESKYHNVNTISLLVTYFLGQGINANLLVVGRKEEGKASFKVRAH